MTTQSSVLVAAFDGNDRGFPSLLTPRAHKAGLVERTVAKDGPDQMRIISNPRVQPKVLHPLHAEGFIEKFHQGNGCVFQLPDGTTVAVLFYNSGRTTNAAKVHTSLASMAKVLNAVDADLKVMIFVEFGEGDKGYNEHDIARKYFTSDTWKEFFPTTRETMFVSRKSGKKVDDTDVVKGSSVKHESPTREVITLTLSGYGLTLLAFHSAAGYTNGHRPSKVKALLGVSWRRTLVKAQLAVSHALLGTAA